MGALRKASFHLKLSFMKCRSATIPCPQCMAVITVLLTSGDNKMNRWKDFYSVEKFGDYCHVRNSFTSHCFCFVAPLEGKRAEIGRITSKHAKVSREVAEETFDNTNNSKPPTPEVDKTTSNMNGPVSDDQDDLDTNEGELCFHMNFNCSRFHLAQYASVGLSMQFVWNLFG